MILTINGQQAALKKGSSIEYVSENRIFTDADDYSMEIELPLADCPQNLAIFGMITRKDVDTGDIFFRGAPLSLRKRPEGRWLGGSMQHQGRSGFTSCIPLRPGGGATNSMNDTDVSIVSFLCTSAFEQAQALAQKNETIKTCILIVH